MAGNLEFSMDDETGKTIVKVVDSTTKELIRRSRPKKCWRSPGRWIACRVSWYARKPEFLASGGMFCRTIHGTNRVAGVK